MKRTIYKHAQFNSANPLQVDTITIEHLPDPDPDLSYFDLLNEPEDRARLEAYNRGDWHCIGIRARADVSYPIGQGSRRLERFTSGGLWGIESDSDASYIASVERDELEDLAIHLSKFGVPMPVFPKEQAHEHP